MPKNILTRFNKRAILKIQITEGVFKMKKRLLAMVFATAVGTVALTGCGGGSKDATTSAETESQAEKEADAADSHDETIVVYTNSGSEGRDEYLTKKAADAGFNIQVVALGAF